MRAVATGLLLLIVACLAWPPAQAQLYNGYSQAKLDTMLRTAGH